ncbi:MAG: dihydrolipoyllysine-residue acetyltransferase [bacterium]|nr:dihydrolipoyllysine-residue acetyltransferase [bacterium]
MSMAKIQEVRLPDIGETAGVSIVEVLVKPGERVEVDDPLITLESDKASMEVPSPFAGEVREVKVKMGDGLSENAVIAILEADEAAAPGETVAEHPEPVRAEAPSAASPEPSPPPVAAEPPSPTPAGPVEQKIDEEGFVKAYASPSVRRLARELGVDLSKVRGSGRKDRIVKDDVRAYVKSALAGPPPAAAGFSLPAMPEIDFSKFGPIETKPLSRIRKLSAASLHRSWLHVPHVTQFDEADVTEMEAFRKEHAAEAESRGFKLTPVSFLLKAAAVTLKAFPEFSASLDPSGDNLILKHFVHIGVAVDTPNGLIVPVVRDVDKKGLFELAGELAATSARARDGKLLPQDLQGGCFSISSLGGIGGTAFTPIVNAPEVAILGVSRAVTRPIFRDGEFVPRLMLPLSLSYDHRVIDGAQAARFIVHLSRVLADIRRILL